MRSLDLGQEYLEDPLTHRLTPNEVDVDGDGVENTKVFSQTPYGVLKDILHLPSR